MAERQRESVPFHVLINPKLTPVGEPDAEFFEGCLSLTGFTALVPRYRQVRVECLNENAEKQTIEGQGWYARILQHEIDHLGGVLYIDRMRTRTFMSAENFAVYTGPVVISQGERGERQRLMVGDYVTSPVNTDYPRTSMIEPSLSML